MKTSSVILGLAAAAPSLAQERPTETSICDYYSAGLFGASNMTTQYTLLTALVNTVVAGNYSESKTGMAVPGILAPGEVNGTAVNLLPYFSGGLASTNRGDKAVSVNFLDGGGAAPLIMNMPAQDETSNQYKLLTHLYQYFGALLGCSATDYPAYMGRASMAQVHKFMNLDQYEITWFIQQVGGAAASFGVAEADITIVATTLNKAFNYRCSPEATIIPAQGAQLQSMCTNSECPLDPMANCDAYQGYGVEPANATSSSGTPTSSGTPSATSGAGGSASPTFTGAASRAGYAIPAGLFALAAFAL